MNSEFSTIEKALEDLSNGKLVIVVDDENRENEGDFIAIAESISPDTVNFMATHGRGLICVPLPDNRCEQLNLMQMVENNTDPTPNCLHNQC
jgi:3,4-dihydroxy 2-butanone 4-phosphate synthase/GTP cyclohydrolase II